MKKRPILFSAPMVRAILDGRKSQTRRIVKGAWHQPEGYLQSKPEGEDGEWYFGCAIVPASFVTNCPFGKIGDRLWVKETFRVLHDPATSQKDALTIDYRADGEDRIMDKIGKGKWKPSIFMARFQSRITLEIVSVRVERLQEISEVDAMAEGCIQTFTRKRQAGGAVIESTTPAVEHFEQLWDSLDAKRGFGWDKNPFVWRIEFKRIKPI